MDKKDVIALTTKLIDAAYDIGFFKAEGKHSDNAIKRQQDARIELERHLTSQSSRRDSPDAKKVAIGECPYCNKAIELKNFWLESRSLSKR